DESPAAPEVASAQAFVLEAELLVEPDRRLVVREDVQLELLDAVLARPLDGLFEQGAPDAPAPVPRCDHQAEVGDVRARWVRIASERQARDDAVLVLGHVDGRVRRPARGPEVAPLVTDATPVALRDQPGLRLRADGTAELDEGSGITRCCAPNRVFVHDSLGQTNSRKVRSTFRDYTTIPWPPRRGSPAAAGEPSWRCSTAEAPPK